LWAPFPPHGAHLKVVEVHVDAGMSWECTLSTDWRPFIQGWLDQSLVQILRCFTGQCHLTFVLALERGAALQVASFNRPFAMCNKYSAPLSVCT
jgi:hypothetical protein